MTRGRRFGGTGRGLRVRSCAAMLALIFLFAGCGKKAEQKMVKPAVPVTIGAVVQKAMPLQISVIGNVEASSTVGIRAQVGGTLTRVHFTEGRDVRKGDLLFTIDPRPYEAALRQAEANVARSNAQFENARAEERRYAELVKKGYVSQTQYEQVRTNAAALESTVLADRALLENAKLNLGYCTIRSLLSGRTGSLMVHEGNLIKANADTPIVTINQIQPVHVTFALPEKDLPAVKKYMAGGTLRVEAYSSKDDRNPAQGQLTFIENAVDMATGTIRLKGSFENRDRKLWPGQFVHVVITLTTQHNAVVVPTQAVQTGQTGPFVFIVKDDLSAEVRPVVVNRTSGEETVIESGLIPGERVVTDGQLRLMPGARVEVKDGQGAEKQGSGVGGQGLGKKEGAAHKKLGKETDKSDNDAGGEEKVK